jgi:hypothetical protein
MAEGSGSDQVNGSATGLRLGAKANGRVIDDDPVAQEQQAPPAESHLCGDPVQGGAFAPTTSAS